MFKSTLPPSTVANFMSTYGATTFMGGVQAAGINPNLFGEALRSELDNPESYLRKVICPTIVKQIELEEARSLLKTNPEIQKQLAKEVEEFPNIHREAPIVIPSPQQVEALGKKINLLEQDQAVLQQNYQEARAELLGLQQEAAKLNVALYEKMNPFFMDQVDKMISAINDPRAREELGKLKAEDKAATKALPIQLEQDADPVEQSSMLNKRLIEQQAKLTSSLSKGVQSSVLPTEVRQQLESDYEKKFNEEHQQFAANKTANKSVVDKLYDVLAKYQRNSDTIDTMNRQIQTAQRVVQAGVAVGYGQEPPELK